MSLVNFLVKNGIGIDNKDGKLVITCTKTLDELYYLFKSFKIEDEKSFKIENEKSLKIEINKSFKIENEKKFPNDKYPFCFGPSFSYSIPDHVIRRKLIRSLLKVNSEPISCYPNLDICIMEQMFQHYNHYFFAGLLKAQADFNNLKYKFEIGTGSKSNAGSCSIKDGNLRIKLHKGVFDNITESNCNKLKVNGIVPLDRLDAIMIVFEHELIHAGYSSATGSIALELMNENHGPSFKKMVLCLFGHQTCSHSLIPNETEKKYSLNDFSPNARITFKLKGVITMATVLETKRTKMVVITDAKSKYCIDPSIVISILN